MRYYAMSDTGLLEKKRNPSASIRSRTYDLPITSSDALPLSYRRLVGAKAIKLGSWDNLRTKCTTRKNVSSDYHAYTEKRPGWKIEAQPSLFKTKFEGPQRICKQFVVEAVSF